MAWGGRRPELGFARRLSRALASACLWAVAWLEAGALAQSVPAPATAEGEPVRVAESIVPAVGGPQIAAQPSYILERVEVRGHARTNASTIRQFVPLVVGHAFEVSDPDIESARYRLLGTGWFDRVELRLERGSEPGAVVLVIDVSERRTLVFQQLAAGVGWSVEGVESKAGEDAPPGRKAEPYLGLGVAETNFLGLGKTLGGLALVSPDQQGLELSYFDPVVRSSRWSLSTHASFVNGQEYFGGDNAKNNEVRVSVDCSPTELEGRERDECEIAPPVAVVDYYRVGLGLGTARDVGAFTRLSLGFHGDFVYVPPGKMPAAASEVFGRGSSARRVRPIDFAIEPYESHVSMFSVGLTYEKRDSAVLPSRGVLASFLGDLASSMIGSDYEFVRLQTRVQRWQPLPWGHVLRLGAFGGAVFGRAPFMYKFFVADLTDLQPSRILGINLDHRPAPNLFGVLQCGRAFDDSCGTAVAQMRAQDLAARIDAEYAWPFARSGRGFLKGGDVFALVGLYGLADATDLRLSVPGYGGIARAPIDLTVDVGVRLDTQAGVFQVGFAKLFWLPVQ
jgi:hypothetical protein